MHLSGPAIFFIVLAVTIFSLRRVINSDTDTVLGMRKITVAALMGTIMIIGGIALGVTFGCGCECIVRDEFTNEEYKGIIKIKYIDTNDRFTRYIVLRDDSKIMFPSAITFDSIQPNDYIIKHRGSLKYWLIRSNDTILFYPTCFQNGTIVEIKDKH